MGKDLDKEELYNAVKVLIDAEGHRHLHLNQHKLFTLFSVAFQYLLFKSTKEPGAYIIRIDDSGLADKLSKRAKDASTRKFLQTLLLPRKLKYNRSTFYLDFFHISSWNLTNEIPSDKIKGALIVKITSNRPMLETMEDDAPSLATPIDVAQTAPAPIPGLPEDYYLSSLKEFVPTTITIAFECEFQGLHQISLPIIKKDKERTVYGVTIADNIDWDNLD